MKTLIPLLILTVSLIGCGKLTTTVPHTVDEKIQYAEQMSQAKLFNEAQGAWKEIRDAYISPEINQLADFKLAETYFLQENFVEAAAAYETFLKTYPRSHRRAEALFRLGVCYERQMLDPERDQAPTLKAREIFAEFLKRYPDSPRRQYALDLIDRCNNRLAAHEVTVGRYYLQKGNYDAAIARLDYVLLNYPSFPERNTIEDYLDEAENRGLGESKAGRLMDKLYRLVLENEALRELQNNIMGIFDPI